MTSTQRPNFLFITTDQHRADHLGCYGNPLVRTPNIDRIAAQGRRFERFYVATAVCMPNRATLMTGRMPSVHGVRCNGIPLSRNATTFVDLLRDAGYRTALVGKCHLQNMTDLPPETPRRVLPEGFRAPALDLADAVKNRWQGGGYDMESLAKWRSDPTHRVATPYYGFDHVDLCTMHGDMVETDYARWLNEVAGDPDRLRGAANALPDPRYTAPQAYRTRVPEELYPTAWIGDRAADYLDAAADASEPFFLHCSFPDPHHPFTPPGKYWDMYDPDEVVLPPSFAHAGPSSVAPVATLHEERRGGRGRIKSTVAFAAQEREAREAIALTYGMITMIDDAVGRLLAKLAERGLDRNTIVVFTSDHGDFMGDHGLLLKSALHYQGLIRVPFIWSEPGLPQPGAATQALSGTVDIAATMLERAQLAPYCGIQGRSLLPNVREPAAPAHDAVLVEEDGHAPTFGMSEPIRLRTVVTSNYRLSIYDHQNWIELYDLARDPHELANVADDPQYAVVRAQMFEVMAREMMLAADRSPLPTGRA